ncbi:MAG: 16S rRNA (adenine(1518)-N(6)/adenine(1519)-N(6))-dimethyltransferase RsmA, partial [bacterium]|nr:16S rRNA (adenine(1518)-N(6)/adenine(1519)-N(6))-dimethyltransferase RsmA [bacterium]
LDVYPDEDVLEIGSGLSVLTAKLGLHAQRILAIEKDKRLLNIAREEFSELANLTFHEADFLKCDLSSLLKKYHTPIKVIGNIPYYISSQIILALLDNAPLFQRAVLTVQKEVADRLAAEPSSKDYGILTIFIGAKAQCDKLFDLAPEAFIPPPEVTSTAIKITFTKNPSFQIQNELLFKKIVKTAFQQRRKTIKNSLKILLKNNRIKPWSSCNIEPELRPEQLTVEQYVALANYLAPLL